MWIEINDYTILLIINKFICLKFNLRFIDLEIRYLFVLSLV